MNDREKLLNFCDQLVDNNKEQIKKAEHTGDLTRVYFHEGSISAIEVIKGALER